MFYAIRLQYMTSPEAAVMPEDVDASRPVIMGALTDREADTVQHLSEEFDSDLRDQEKQGVEKRLRPFVAKLSDLSLDQVQSIAELFRAEVTEGELLKGIRVIRIPHAASTISFHPMKYGQEDSKDEHYRAVHITTESRDGAKIHNKYTRFSAAEDTLVVKGKSSVSFVQDTSDSSIHSYRITTVTSDGTLISGDFPRGLLKQPLHRVNLAKAITESSGPKKP